MPLPYQLCSKHFQSLFSIGQAASENFPHQFFLFSQIFGGRWGSESTTLFAMALNDWNTVAAT